MFLDGIWYYYCDYASGVWLIKSIERFRIPTEKTLIGINNFLLVTLFRTLQTGWYQNIFDTKRYLRILALEESFTGLAIDFNIEQSINFFFSKGKENYYTIKFLENR